MVLHRELHNDPALYAFALAHELGHALDPQLEHLPDDYRRRRHHGSFEVVAESAAVRSLKSFGLVLEDEDAFLNDSIRHGTRRESWKRALTGDLYDRYQVCAMPLLKPTLNDELAQTRDKTYRKSRRRAYRRAISEKHRRRRRPPKDTQKAAG